MRDPLLPPLAAVSCGVLASRFVVFGAGELLGAITALAVLAVIGHWKSTRRAAMAACLAALVFAGALAGLAHRPGPPPQLDAGAREVLILSGCVVEPPVFSQEREQFVLELEPGARARASLYLRPGQRPPELRYGQRVELDARVRRTQNFRNPGAFDYAGYLARQDIYWTASAVAGAPVKVLPGECGSRFRRAVFALRTAALERLERLYRGDSYQTAMMQAILIGESSGLEKVWTEDFRRTGTYHALVISGLHVTVLAAFFLFLMRLCFLPQTSALVLTTLAAWLYALVSGWQAPVVRAAAGFMLFAIGRWLYRRARVLNLLAAVAIAFVVLDPEQMFDASFQLSFLSVTAIGALAVPLLERTSLPLARGLAGLPDTSRDPHLEPRVAHFRLELRLLGETLWLWTRIPQRVWLIAAAIPARGVFFVWETVVISAVVQFGLALPMAVYFHRLSLTGLSANVAIVPLMSAVVPAGFVAIFTGWKFAAAIAGWLLGASQWIAGWHVRWEPNWRIPDPPLWLAIAFTAALLASALLRRKTLLCVSVLLLVVMVWHPFPPESQPGVLELTAIDVGQGESLFLSFPDGKLAVLDGGGIPAFGQRRRPRLDIGEDVVSPYLWSRSIRRLDAVALTHAHEDHLGGLVALIDNFHPKELWTGAVSENADWARVRDAAIRHRVRIVRLESGRRFPYGGAQVEVLAPLAEYQPAPEAHNNDSLVLRLRYGRHSFLLTGDIERQVEWELAGRGLLLRTDVLKVAHHGSNTSSTPPFLELVRPAFAVISCGLDNPFRNPHPEVLRRLAQSRTCVLRTDLWGMVSVRTDGRRFRADTMRWSQRRRGLYSAF